MILVTQKSALLQMSTQTNCGILIMGVLVWGCGFLAGEEILAEGGDGAGYD